MFFSDAMHTTMIKHNHRFQILVWIGIASLAAYLAVSIYLGAFTYYLADDYCEAVRVTSAPTIFDAVLERYITENWPRATMRYSNLFFVGISESLGERSVPATIIFMATLWFAGLVWLLHELRRRMGVTWHIQMDLFLGLLLGFFSFLQAPNIFQTVYWRSSMMTHFAPLVFGSMLAAFLLRQSRRAESRPVSPLLYLVVLFASFVIAGFSEPPTTTLLTALPLLLFAVWLWGKPPARNRILALLSFTFAGVFLGFLAMLFSPAAANEAQAKAVNLVEIFGTSFVYAYYFIVDSLKTQPLPGVISFLIPLLLIWLHRQGGASESRHRYKRLIWILIPAIPLLAWLLIAAGFAPSVYGQSYPVERMRFLARAILVAVFMLEGTFLGLLLERVPFTPNPKAGRIAATAVFAVITIVYPLRAAVNMLRYDVPEFRGRTEVWRLREAYIVRQAGLGERHIVIPGLSVDRGVKEIDNDPNHWVNGCAAQFYGVDSIRAVSMEDEYILDYLNE